MTSLESVQHADWSEEALTETGERNWHLVPALPLAVIAVLVVAALAAPWLSPHDPVVGDLADRLIPPAWMEGGSSAHILGTDTFGRDVLTRLIYGVRTSLSVVALSLAVAVMIGTTVGVVAGHFGGWLDAFLMRVVDVMLSVPPILLAIAVAVAVGPSFRNVVLILGFLIWPGIARLIRGETLGLTHRDFVRYSMASGLGKRHILTRHVFPNVLPILLVAVTLETASVILTEASLSFLGAGIPPPHPSWGVMIEEGGALIATGWWIAFFPGVLMIVTVLAFNSIGDWLRDYLDPTTRLG